MDEGSTKAIPLRRSRGTAVRSAPASGRSSDGIGASVRGALTTPRQLWLATLGGTALAVRGVRTVWTRLVAEGDVVESTLRGSLPSVLTRSSAQP